jgi:DNA-binding PadR family transcriptional regulator
MSSTTRLLVLGVVRIFQPVHGYDVRRELVSWHVEEWASLAPGSIYNQLKTLAKEGLIEATGKNQVGGRPERTSYKVTPRGEVELSELLRETLWQWRMPIDPLVAAISLMGLIKRDELIAGLEARQAIVAGGVAHAEYAINAIDDVETPAHVREMLRLINARVSAEIGWSKAFVDRLKKGEYRTLGDPVWIPGALGAPPPKADPRKRVKPKRTKRTSQKRR